MIGVTVSTAVLIFGSSHLRRPLCAMSDGRNLAQLWLCLYIISSLPSAVWESRIDCWCNISEFIGV